MKKEVVLVFLLFGIFQSLGSADALGIMFWHNSYANFQPGAIFELHYVVHGIPPYQDVRVYAAGDLAQYVEISPEKITGGGDFVARIRLPEVIEQPGPHVVYFHAAEVVGEGGGGIGTAVTIKVPFTIFVPYPGRYASAKLIVGDINVGDPLWVTIEGTNLGTENNTLKAGFDIFSQEGKVDSFDLGSQFIPRQENFGFSKKVDTISYKPGEYRVAAWVDYGSLLGLDGDFRIGSLFVSILNYTSRFEKDALQKFEIEAESKWNNLIDEVYAEVRVFNTTNNVSVFKTPSESLERWSKKILTGFFDTRGLGVGVYQAEIHVFYASGKKSAQTSKQVTIEIVESWWIKYKGVLIVAGVAVFLLLISVVFVFYLLIKKFKKRKR